MNELILVIHPHIRKNGIKHPNAFDACLDGELICTSETPLFSGARALLASGKARRNDVLIMRHASSDCNAMIAPVGLAAGFIIEETGNGPKRRKWSRHGMALWTVVEKNEEGLTTLP